MDANGWITLLLLGLLVGALGQGVRVIVGLKKVNDTARVAGAAIGDLIEPSRLATSLLIGAIAGALAVLGMQEASAHAAPMTLTVQSILGIAGAGYAGADFIEGFMRRVAPDNAAAAASPANATPAADGSVG